MQTYAQGVNCKNLISINYIFPEQKKSYLLKLKIMLLFYEIYDFPDHQKLHFKRS